ncbi:MAG: hypothetical protein VBE63_11605 [Lamprobacter sp.]|uniref:hypothetical protein n=1 Tax=Lamprobacter sp. TaxID=3100796 RepID=UPI002B25DB72|nr:hypothetical protein [Lamprobacter sp.]MEA3640575.1 hypothetical protein [Lamprobacter sp.]
MNTAITDVKSRCPREQLNALLLLLIAAVATTDVAAQAPVDPAEPGEAMRTPSGEPWRGNLQSGAEVWVDPRTNRPMTQGPGYRTQLWDGVYRLNDGTELHVRDGRVVPTTEMLERRQATPMPPPAEEQGAATFPEGGDSRHCQVLVEQACGRDNACADATKCSAARQLVDMAAEQRAQQVNPDAITGTGLKCREALRDSFFAPCHQGAAAGEEGTAPAR